MQLLSILRKIWRAITNQQSPVDFQDGFHSRITPHCYPHLQLSHAVLTLGGEAGWVVVTMTVLINPPLSYQSANQPINLPASRGMTAASSITWLSGLILRVGEHLGPGAQPRPARHIEAS